jgi:hypothetical protein
MPSIAPDSSQLETDARARGVADNQRVFSPPYKSQKADGGGAARLFRFLVSGCNVDFSGCFNFAVELTGVDYTPNHASGTGIELVAPGGRHPVEMFANRQYPFSFHWDIARPMSFHCAGQE